jgi:hypothetical protein
MAGGRIVSGLLFAASANVFMVRRFTMNLKFIDRIAWISAAYAAANPNPALTRAERPEGISAEYSGFRLLIW